MGRRPRTPTLQQLAAAHVGQVKGAKVVAFLICWAVAEEALGHPPTLDEYADWWNESRATAFREQARFREAFPGETTPQRIVDVLKAQEGATWFKRGIRAGTRLAVRGDEIIAALRGSGSQTEGEPA